MKQEQPELATEKIPKLLFKMALPAILAQFINLLYNIVDRMFIGRIPGIGALALTGVGLTLPIIILIAAFAALVSMGAAPRASIMLGKKNKKEAEKILGNAFSTLIIVSIIITLMILFFGKDILMLFGASENTIGYALDYIHIYALGTLFVQLTLGLNAFIIAQGFANKSMQTILIGAIINIILDPILIFGFNLGVEGVALATIIAQAVSATWVLHFLLGSKTTIKIKRNYFKLEKNIILPSLALGLSPFIMQITEAILVVVFNTSLQKYGGDLAIGTMTILNTVMQFSMLPLIGLTQGGQPIMSYNFGANQLGRVRDTFKLLLKSAFIYSTFLWVAIMLKPDFFARIFTTDSDLIIMVISSIRIFMAASFLFSIQIICQQTFIALGNARVSIILALLRKVILLIPLIYTLPLFLEDSVTAIFLAEPLADTIAVIITATTAYVSFKKILFKKDSVPEKHPKNDHH